MHSALFVAGFPEKGSVWPDFLIRAKVTKQKYPNVLRLAENVWLVNFQENPAPLAWLVSAADAYGVAYGIVPFEHAPEWLPADFDPNTISVQNEET